MGRLSGLFSLASPPLLLVDSKGRPGGGWHGVSGRTRAAWQTGGIHMEVKGYGERKKTKIKSKKNIVTAGGMEHDMFLI